MQSKVMWYLIEVNKKNEQILQILQNTWVAPALTKIKQEVIAYLKKQHKCHVSIIVS